MSREPTVKESVYISAVKGRSDFRKAYKLSREQNQKLEARIAQLKSEREEHVKRIEKLEALLAKAETFLNGSWRSTW